jgi:multidrug transporter EmrE-like cation transporter
MKKENLAVFIVVFSTLFTAAGQYFLKRGSPSSLLEFITNIDVVIGALFYFTGAVLLIISLKNGKLSSLYPIYSLTYVWVILIAYYSFGESITLLKVCGIVSIIAGVVLIGVDSND